MNLEFRMNNDNSTSIHSDINAEIHNVPMSVLIRPIPPIVDEEKVQSLMDTLNNPETESLVPPIDVLWIKGSEGNKSILSFFSFFDIHIYIYIYIYLSLFQAVIIIIPLVDVIDTQLIKDLGNHS